MGRSDYELQAAAEFLFERRPLRRRAFDVQPGEARVTAGNQSPHRVTRHEERVIGRGNAPILTIVSDPHSSITVVGGSGPDRSAFFSAEAGGQTQSEADERLRQRSFSATGSTVSLNGPNLYEGRHTRSELLVEAPQDAGVVIHASYTAVDVRDMAGPVWIAATHARARILDTTGQVDATAGCVDFAGSCGRITLSADFEINLKITDAEFDGILLAWAQRPVRMLVPSEFNTPFEAVVGSPDDFVCRAEFRSKVKQSRLGELYVFSYDVSADDGLQARLHLRSEASTVVIDQRGENR